MKKLMVPLLAILVCLGFLPQMVFAGGIDNKQNFSARYLATGSRNAAIDGADVAAYNPAGLMQQKDGFAIELDAQYLFKVYENRYTSENDGHVMKDQDLGSAVPAFFATYKQGNWGLFGAFTINGGGGAVDYESGNAVTDAIERTAGAIGLLDNEWLEADSYYLTFTTGPTFAFLDMFSVALGGRYIMAEKSIDAYALVNGGAWNGLPLVAAYEEEATGYGWVVSLDFKPMDNLLIALRYESEVELEFETDLDGKNTAIGNTTLGGLGKTEGGKYNRDLPALLGVGIAFKPMDKLTLDSSLTYYFEEQADLENHTSKNLDNSYDAGISATYAITDAFRVSLGYMYTDVGIDPDDYGLVEKISPVLDAHSCFFGMGYDFNAHATIEFGAMLNVYDQGDDATTTSATTTRNIEYSKYNTGLALGFIYKF
ncbi:MAG: outer membrane protein transport protein [Pseudomonadota bacterium]